MALKLRLARRGTKKRPFYSIVVAEASAPRDGRFVEKLGTYDPRLPQESPNRICLDDVRVKHWLGVGAKPTERVALFLGKAGLAEMPKQAERPKKSAPGKKAQERLKEKQAKAEEAAAVAKKAAEEKKVAAEEKKVAAEESTAQMTEEKKEAAAKEASVKASEDKKA